MNTEERNKIRKILVREIEKSEQDISALAELVKPIAPDNAIGRLSRMEAINARSVNQAALSAVKVKLTKLKWALSHIEEPDFGICIECGEPIPIGRILLMPETNMCVPCMEELGE
ncbi:MAG: TraR/DksA C4-type zinc finger protein [Desulfobulbaceae bacterium]|nr:TraR/DksA C4-type zinc finger protein [Desulfobulbaceae bacterium]